MTLTLWACWKRDRCDLSKEQGLSGVQGGREGQVQQNLEAVRAEELPCRILQQWMSAVTTLSSVQHQEWAIL